jgi:hypothetical protein
MQPEDDLISFLEIAPGFYATKEFVEKMMKHPRLIEEYERRGGVDIGVVVEYNFFSYYYISLAKGLVVCYNIHR